MQRTRFTFIFSFFFSGRTDHEIFIYDFSQLIAILYAICTCPLSICSGVLKVGDWKKVRLVGFVSPAGVRARHVYLIIMLVQHPNSVKKLSARYTHATSMCHIYICFFFGRSLLRSMSCRVLYGVLDRCYRRTIRWCRLEHRCLRRAATR